MATGIAILNFGAFPGTSDAAVTITGQAGIVSGSLVEAWIRPVATADHTVDEHMVETIQVFAHSIVPGTGFTISGFNTSQANEPLRSGGVVGGRGAVNAGIAGPLKGLGGQPSVGGIGTRIYGTWTIAWAGNYT